MSETAVVRIYATTQEPDYDSPWQARVPQHSTGSGVVIGENLILTGAHVVADGTFLQVQKISDPNKVVAMVKGICHDCDLALLEVADASFMQGVTPPTVGKMPNLRDRVSVVGFPVGGDEISITEGVVSRVEVQRYSHSQRHLLAITVDAAINPGNSGGPVFKDGEVVGIAFQKLTNADGIGEMVPPPLIQHFLRGVEREPRMRIPAMGITAQGLENGAQRRVLQMKEGDSGILVLGVEWGSSASTHLQAGDAILAIEGHAVANNATIRYRGTYRTRYDVLLGEKYVGDPLHLTILRGGERMDLSFPLLPQSVLVPRSQYDVEPPYFIFGGLVFQPLSRDFLTTWDTWWDKAPKEFLHLYYSGRRCRERQEVVVLSQVLADELNVGYEDLYSESVLSVNGQAPRDMAHFVKLVESAGETLTIQTSSRGVIVFDTEAARAAQPRILQRYRIEHDRSTRS